MLRSALVAFLLAGGLVAAQPDYFPLRPGNQWTYRASRFGNSFTLEILEAGTEAPAGYSLVRGFPGGDVWLRMSDEGTLYAWNPRTGSEAVWAAFGSAAGEPYSTSIDPCSKTGVIRSKAAKAEIPIGQFDNALAISYPPTGCADAGLTSEMYLPYVGLVQRTTTTFAGPVVYDLVYARLNDGLTIITAPEQSFTLGLDNVTYSPGAMATARLTVRNTMPTPLRLTFPSGQRYDVIVRNEKGDVVYQWSDGKAFTMVFGTMDVTGERTWLVTFPVPGKAGRYEVEAWLATPSPAPRGHAAIDVK
jgi:hypothetical protein